MRLYLDIYTKKYCTNPLAIRADLVPGVISELIESVIEAIVEFIPHVFKRVRKSWESRSVASLIFFDAGDKQRNYQQGKAELHCS